MTNNEQQNDLVIHNVFANGTVVRGTHNRAFRQSTDFAAKAYARSVSTGGKGAANIHTGPPGADSLRSQNPIVVNGNMLFNVNVRTNFMYHGMVLC
jgi:hypothetical protein